MFVTTEHFVCRWIINKSKTLYRNFLMLKTTSMVTVWNLEVITNKFIAGVCCTILMAGKNPMDRLPTTPYSNCHASLCSVLSNSLFRASSLSLLTIVDSYSHVKTFVSDECFGLVSAIQTGMENYSVIFQKTWILLILQQPGRTDFFLWRQYEKCCELKWISKFYNHEFIISATRAIYCRLMYLMRSGSHKFFPKLFQSISMCFHCSGTASNNRDSNPEQSAVAFFTLLVHVPSAICLLESEDFPSSLIMSLS